MTTEKFRDLSELAKLLPPGEQTAAKPTGHDGKGKTVRLSIEKKGRKGKTVTIVAGLQHNPQTMEEIARALKQHCGSGGTVKDGTIEIQGDQRERVAEKLRAMHYVVR